MRATLLTAQKMADSIVREAEAKRDSLLARAETDAQERIAQIRREEEAESDRLRQGQRELAQFISAVRSVCSKELDFLEKLPQLPADIPIPAVPVPETGGAVTVPAGEQPAAGEPAPEDVPAPETVVPPTGTPPPAEDPYPAGDPFSQDTAEPTRRIKFEKLDDLKFGPNYTGGA